MSKATQLAKITQEITRCAECKSVGSALGSEQVSKSVPGEGNPDADVVFIGEAPGRNEAETGRPFVGRSGKLLRSLIASVGLTEEEIFITSPVKYFPGKRTPTKPELLHGRAHLLKQLAVIQPKFLVLLGNSALFALSTKSIPVSHVHGTVQEYSSFKSFVTYHPAAAIRFVKNKVVMEADFQKLHRILTFFLSAS